MTFPRRSRRTRILSSLRWVLLVTLATVLTVYCAQPIMIPPLTIAFTAAFWSLAIWESAGLCSPRIGAQVARFGIIATLISFACVVAIPSVA